MMAAIREHTDLLPQGNLDRGRMIYDVERLADLHGDLFSLLKTIF